MEDSANNVQEVLQNAVKKTGAKQIDPKHLSHESLTLLMTAERLHRLENDSKRELQQLAERQQKVSFLHKLIKTINSMTDGKNEFNWTDSPQLLEMFQKSKEMGVELDEGKLLYNEKERERLLDNITMTVDDLNMLNDLQLQTINRLTNERYESYQMARSILKPLHEAKTGHARNMVSR